MQEGGLLASALGIINWEGKRREGEGRGGEGWGMGGGSRIRQREKWGYSAVSMKASAKPARSRKAGIALPKCPESE